MWQLLFLALRLRVLRRASGDVVVCPASAGAMPLALRLRVLSVAAAVPRPASAGAEMCERRSCGFFFGGGVAGKHFNNISSSLCFCGLKGLMILFCFFVDSVGILGNCLRHFCVLFVFVLCVYFFK